MQRDAGPDSPPANVEQRIKDVGAADFPTRDKARQELQRMGPEIMPLLKPATHSADAEVARPPLCLRRPSRRQ